MRPRRTGLLFAALSLLLATLYGCGADRSGSDEIDCTDEEYYDQVYERCVPRMNSNPEDTGTTSDSEAPDDTESPSTDTSEQRTDTEDSSGDDDTGRPTGECDRDGDRSRAKSCGGNDCDDDDATRSPEYPERCDQIDNDCSGEVNDGIDCSFYAHEDDKLFKINPFTKTATNVGANLPGLHDLDTHPDGTLYGVTPGGFYRFDEANDTWTEVKSFEEGTDWSPTDPNGMAIDRSGTIFITSRDSLYKIEKMEGEWWVDNVGQMGETQMGSSYVSSGDAVIYKKTLWMTSKHAMGEDHLVQLDPSSAMASDPLAIGYKEVFGLTTAWGELYGLTQAGELIDIDPRTGESMTIHEFDHEWYGAASTPRRDGRRSK